MTCESQQLMHNVLPVCQAAAQQSRPPLLQQHTAWRQCIVMTTSNMNDLPACTAPSKTSDGLHAAAFCQHRLGLNGSSRKLPAPLLHLLASFSMLQAHSTPGLPPHLARSFHISALTRDERDYYQDRLQGVVKYLGQHRPWLIKDPRLSWLAPLWLEQLEAPLCVLVVDMQPERLAQHLAQQQQERQMHSSSDDVVVSSATHLERWTNATLSSLKVRDARGSIQAAYKKQQQGLQRQQISCRLLHWCRV